MIVRAEAECESIKGWRRQTRAVPEVLMIKQLPRTPSVCALLILPILTVMLTVGSASADSSRKLHSGSLARQIRDLSARIYHRVYRSHARQRELRKARWHLKQAMALLDGDGEHGDGDYGDGDYGDGDYDDGDYDGDGDYDDHHNSRQACVEWAYKNYQRSHSSSFAWNQANKQCTRDVNLRIAKVLYPFFSKSYSAGFATTEAIKAAKETTLRGKKRLLKFSLVAYHRSYSGGHAAQEAVRHVAKASRRAFRCIEQSYNAYVRSYSSSHALNEAFRVCAHRSD